MRLKRLELFGFKSFADRTVFEFGDDTLTGVVGPNGCGKSNVVDALRWVLGEQRPTSMRGKEMTDVIFKGCTSRPPMSVADATVVIDNRSGTLDGRGSEVEITRRVFKSGEGEYLIDGQRVRLKDVREMLFDTGLGGRGYSVLEQGRIDAVLSANPIDRRRIFEEAAGISRYRQRKHETELRLARVEQDLARVDDVTGELRTRVRSLKIQAGRAERYVAAREEWGRERGRLLRHQLHALGGELEGCAAGIEAIEGELAGLRGARESGVADIALLEAERAALLSELERLSTEATRLEGDGRALAERRSHLGVRAGALQQAAVEEEQRAQALQDQLAERAAEIARLERERAALEQGVAGARRAAQGQKRERGELERGYRQARRSVEEQNEAVLALLHEKTEAANAVRHLELARGPAGERSARVEERLSEARSSCARAAQEERFLAAGLGRAEAQMAEAERALRAAEAAALALESELSALEGERKRVEIECARRASAIESLLDRERELCDLDAGARAVLAAAGQDGGPCPAAELSGLLADHLRTGTGFARALDAVLGERAQALIVRDERAALAVAAWLREGVGGLAGMAVPGALASPPAPEPAPLDGALAARRLGRLRAEVVCDAGYEVLADAVCGDVLVAADLEAALAVVRAAPGWRCVTPAGELVDAAGIVGGRRALAQGPVGRRSSAAELSLEVRALEEEACALDQRLEGLRARRATERERSAGLQAELEQRRAATSAAQSAATTACARASDLAAALSVLAGESRGVIEERERIETELVGALELRTSSEREFAAANEELARREARRHALEQEREALGREEGRAQVELTRVQEQAEGLDRRLCDLRRACADCAGELERARRLAGLHAQGARDGRAENEELAQRGAELLEQRAQVDEQLARLRAHAAEGEKALEHLRRGADGVTRRIEAESTELSRMRLDEQRLRLSRDGLLRRAEEELELDGQSLLAGFEPEPELVEQGALDALEGRVRELKSSLEALGPVNMEALGELEDVVGRLEFLETQSEDLARSRKVLNETLKRIEVESERLFVETFGVVRKNFQRIFRQLFGGGRADVSLEAGRPVLEAGVDIVARAPGRELLPIGLLSGGQRTMTALALLFAVFEARPSPFCVLDEVDAALDDANIQRFLGMLESFRSSTQFVLVTHNKGSMAACESLYGVTMATKGISRQVSVELDEVDAFVPEATGRAEERPAALDEESGEPVIELVPAGSGAKGSAAAEPARESATAREV